MGKCIKCKYYNPDRVLLFGLGFYPEDCEQDNFSERENCKKYKFSLISWILNKTIKKIPF